jgi:hypothetical protein
VCTGSISGDINISGKLEHKPELQSPDAHMEIKTQTHSMLLSLTILVASSSPCVERAHEGVVLQVDNFKEPQAAIDAAIERAKTEPTALLFSSREYRLGSPGTHEPVLKVDDATGQPLRIDGCGASIVVTSPTAGLFSISNTHGISVGNFTVDYDPLPMTQGKVTAVKSSTEYTIQLDAGFPSLMLPYFNATTNKWAIVKDPSQPTRHKLGTLNLIRVAGWVDRGGGVFDVKLQLCSNRSICSGANLSPGQYADVSPKVGDPVVHLARFDSYPTFGLSKCENCTFESITIHASPSGTWVAVEASGLVVRGARVEPKHGRYSYTIH